MQGTTKASQQAVDNVHRKEQKPKWLVSLKDIWTRPL
jgi:hypothetical protein